jgi:hypothetical protein
MDLLHVTREFITAISMHAFVDPFQHRAKILAHIILDDPRLRSYADIGRKAFGPKSTSLTSALFCLELFALRFASA